MADLFDNPMGLDGFEFVEFTAPEKGVLEPVFEKMGFTLVARHRSKDVELWRQGDINFVTNYELSSHAFYYAREHGPSACGMAFRVKDATAAYERALAQGAEPVVFEPPGDIRVVGGIAEPGRLGGPARVVRRTFAEIGAGQETANWFFRVSASAGTVAKSISAYDMTMSDAIYGKSARYVSRQRLRQMLDHEFGILVERLGKERQKDTTFFSFCNTVALETETLVFSL